MYFKLRNKKEDPTSVLLAHQCWDKRLIYSTRLKVSPANWDASKQKSKSRKDAQLNNELHHLRVQAEKTLLDFSSRSINPSAAELKDAIDQAIGRKVPEARKTLLEVVDELESARSKSAAGMFKALRLQLKTFAPTAMVDEAGEKFLEGFYAFLSEQSLSSIYKFSLVTYVKSTLSLALKNGYTSDASFRAYKVRKGKSADSVYLTDHEIRQLYEFPHAHPSVRRVVDLFVLQCEIGLRYSDIQQLSESNFTQRTSLKGDQVTFLEITTQKTKERVAIPLSSLATEIASKYNFDEIRKYSIAHANNLIKAACEDAGINENVTATLNGKLETLPKFRFITTHTARRSFATNSYIAGVPGAVIMKMTGHTSEAVFMQYIRASSLESAMRAADHPYFKRKREMNDDEREKDD